MYVACPIHFSASEWGAETQDLQLAVDRLTEAKWEKILESSLESVGKYKPISAFKGNYAHKALNGRRSGRANIIISDDEEGLDGTTAPAA